MSAARNETGSATLELVVFAPLLLLFISVVVFGGRVAIAGQAVQQAADEAARTASIARTQGEADRTAARAARETLEQQDLECTRLRVDVDTSGFAATTGQASSVVVTVTCPVRVSDLALPGVRGTRVVKATASSAIDTWRQR